MIKSPAIFERPYEKERSNRKSILVVVRSLIEDHLIVIMVDFYCYYFFFDPDNPIGFRETRL